MLPPFFIVIIVFLVFKSKIFDFFGFWWENGKEIKYERFLSFLENRKYKLITKPLKEYNDHSPEHPHRKANFDVEIAVDSVFRLDDFDTFILFSGDCDFEYLLKFLRGHGKIAIIFSSAGHISKELPPASSYYFDIVDFRQHLLKMTEKKAKDPAF